MCWVRISLGGQNYQKKCENTLKRVSLRRNHMSNLEKLQFLDKRTTVGSRKSTFI